MKRQALLSHLQNHGCQFVREGPSHSIWINPQTHRKESIPRHNDIKKHLARSIRRHLSVQVPAGD